MQIESSQMYSWCSTCVCKQVCNLSDWVQKYVVAGDVVADGDVIDVFARRQKLLKTLPAISVKARRGDSDRYVVRRGGGDRYDSSIRCRNLFRV